MLAKIKKTALKLDHTVFTGASCPDGYLLQYNKVSDQYILSSIDKSPDGVDEFLSNFNWDRKPGSTTDSVFIQAFKESNHEGIDYDKGNFATDDPQHFFNLFWLSRFPKMEWKWSEKLDKRMGGKKGVAGRKMKYGGPTKPIRVPIIWEDDVRKFIEFLILNDGQYSFSDIFKKTSN